MLTPILTVFAPCLCACGFLISDASDDMDSLDSMLRDYLATKPLAGSQDGEDDDGRSQL